MKPLLTGVAVISLLHACSLSTRAQATPAARSPLSYVGFRLPRLGGNLQYSLSASETLNKGFYAMNSTASYTSVSGSLSYLSASQGSPFSLVYTGGYLASNSGQPSSAFHSLALSQVITAGSWSLIAADSVHYLPESPTTGLSGLAGLGDLGLSPGQIVSGSGQGLLTDYATRIDNTLSGSLQRRVGGGNVVSGSGTWVTQRFVGDSSGFASDNDLYSGTGAFTHRIDALNSVSGGYTYSKSSYVGSPVSFESQSLNLQYMRRWSRTLAMDISAGPEYTTGTFAASLNYAVNASVTYSGEKFSGAASYIRATNNGSGVVLGARSDSASVSASRGLGRDWSASSSFIFSRTESLDQTLPSSYAAHTLVGAAQLSRQLSHNLSTYASYTLQRQTTGQNLSLQQAFSGISQTVGFGITYAPRAVRLDR